MDYFESFGRTTVDDLSENIVKIYKKFNDNIVIVDYHVLKDRVVFQLKLKGNTRKTHIHAHAPDVQQRLQLPVFQIVEYRFVLYIIVAEQKIKYPNLGDVLDRNATKEPLAGYALPYVIGHDPIGRLITADLVKLNHLLIGGSSNSGKTVNLHALITSIIYTRTPAQVNFVMIDVGANDLQLFRELPHLSCPIVSTRDTACRVLTTLNQELERRRKLEISSPVEFSKLPRIVLVIDEFPALFAGADKNTSRLLTDIISAFLQRGRHAKIHVVIAAQNPTFKNMKVDLGNITARIAFKCAKRNFSETILDDSGAELLAGAGDLLFKSPIHNSPQRAQGIYLKKSDILGTVHRRMRQHIQPAHMFKIPSAILETQEQEVLCEDVSLPQPLPHKLLTGDRQFAEIMLWALSRNSVSTNALMVEFGFGWNKASRMMYRLEQVGIVEPLDGKQASHVIPTAFEDLTDNMLDYLHQNGVSDDRLIDGITSR